MLAFSGISHAGFMLMVFYKPPAMQDELFYYAAAYSLAGIAAFAVVLSVCSSKGNEDIVNFNGLGKRSPLMAAVLTCALLSMGGIPIFSGFFAKFFLFSEVLDFKTVLGLQRVKHLPIIIIAVINSIISIGYYFKLIYAMYSHEGSEKREVVPVAYTIVAVVAILLNIAAGLYPQVLLDLV